MKYYNDPVWSNVAIMCLKRNGYCPDCEFESRLESSDCKMKESVKFLIKKIGMPDKVRLARYTKCH